MLVMCLIINTVFSQFLPFCAHIVLKMLIPVIFLFSIVEETNQLGLCFSLGEERND